jgi:hypothetical protein
MDGVALLDEARAAGLAVTADGDCLIITGPREAGPIAARLLTEKARVLSALAGNRVHAPLDEIIAVDEARKHSREDIEARLARLDARAALPDASVLDRAVADDWRRILAAQGAAECL